MPALCLPLLNGYRAAWLAADMDNYATTPIRGDALVEALNLAKARDAN